MLNCCTDGGTEVKVGMYINSIVLYGTASLHTVLCLYKLLSEIISDCIQHVKYLKCYVEVFP